MLPGPLPFPRAILLATAAVAGQPTWITMDNENFRAYSTASERATRNVLNQFERVRSFFALSTGFAPRTPTPVTVVIFGSEAEYQPYRLNSAAAAYYTRGVDRDLIVIGELDSQSAQTATHEYTHLVFEHAGYSLPPWLGEGLAEFFSTLRPSGDYTEFGVIPKGRLQAMGRDPWVPLATILAADRNSPYYNEADKAGSLYDESWALVHMLLTTKKYQSDFWKVLMAVEHGTPSKKALETTYDMPFDRLETALRYYIQDDTFMKLKAKITLDSTENLTGRPADMFDVREIQGELLTKLRGKQAAARTLFEELARENPKRPEPWANLGYLAWSDDKDGEAANNFAKAIELGSRNPEMLLDYARLAEQDNPEGSSAALKTLLELEPNNQDARLEMANLQLDQGKCSDALATSRPITAVKTTRQRDSLLYLRAFCSLRLGDKAEARARARRSSRT